MLTIIPVSFVFNSQFMNYILAISLSVHAYWGNYCRIQTCIQFILFLSLGMDYVLTGYCPESALPVMNIIRYVLTVLSFIGLW